MSQKNELQPWKTERFCIPDADRPRFVAAMEEVLDTYPATYDDKRPRIYMVEAARHLLSDEFDPQPLKPGRAKRVDDKYERHGTCSAIRSTAGDAWAAATTAPRWTGPKR